MHAFDQENSHYGALQMALPDGKLQNADTTWLIQSKASNNIRLGILTELMRLNPPERYKLLQAEVLKFAQVYEKVLTLFDQGIDARSDSLMLRGGMTALDAFAPFLSIMNQLQKMGY